MHNFILILLSIATLSCQSGSLQSKAVLTDAPAPEPEKLFEEDEHLKKFLSSKALAEEFPEQGCSNFKALATEDHFFAPISKMKALKYCEGQSLEQLTQSISEQPEWLKRYSHMAKSQALEPKERIHYMLSHTKYFNDSEVHAEHKDFLKKNPKSKEFSNINFFKKTKKAEKKLSFKKRIKKQFRRRHYTRARRELKKRTTSGSYKNRWEAYKLIYQSYKIQRRSHWNAFLRSGKKWYKFSKKAFKKKNLSKKAYTETVITYSRTVWSYISTEQAINILSSATDILNDKKMMQHWLLGRMHQELGQFIKAEAKYLKALEFKTNDSADKERLLWSLSWLYFLQSTPSKATAYLDQLLQLKVSPYAMQKYQYWKVQSLKETATDHNESLRLIYASDPFGYYGILAKQELNWSDNLVQSCQIESSTQQVANNEIKSHIQYIRALEFVGEENLKQRYLRFHVKTPIKNLRTWKAARPTVKLLQELGDYQTLFTLFHQMDFSSKKQFYSACPKLLFPKPFQKDVEKASKASGVHAAIIYSIMRQESAFHPKARSPMDAFGLMQILPGVAKDIAKQNSLPYSSYKDLYEPQTNIPIGAFLLKRQQEMFNQKFILYVASYNASDKAVRGWQERYKHLPPTYFIESIPYEETKAYVKLVYRNYVHYSSKLAPLAWWTPLLEGT